MRDRAIIHLNVTDFAVAVERVCDRSLATVPLIVANTQAARSIVYDMSEEAYQDGVKKGIPLVLAKRYCPAARILSPRIAVYRRAMKALVREVVDYTPLVEQGEEDGHLFMDVTGTHRLHGPPPDIAWRLRKRVLRSLSLDPTWSLGTNKLVTKVASRVVRPIGELIVAPGEEADFVQSQPISLLPGVLAGEYKQLVDFNLSTIGDLARLNRQQLLVIFQKRADYFYDVSRGRDGAPVLPGGSNQHIWREHIFADDTQDSQELKRVLMGFVHEIGRELRKRKIVTKRVVVSLTYSDGRTMSRQAVEKRGTQSDFSLRFLSLAALERAWQRRIRVRCCTMRCDRLFPQSPQRSLFVMTSAREQRQEKLLHAMDSVAKRFGHGSVGFASSL